MRQVQFAVILHDSAWRLLVNGKRMGRFSARDAALGCACEMARLTRADGLGVEVLVQDAYGEVTTLPRATRRAPTSALPARAEADARGRRTPMLRPAGSTIAWYGVSPARLAGRGVVAEATDDEEAA